MTSGRGNGAADGNGAEANAARAAKLKSLWREGVHFRMPSVEAALLLPPEPDRIDPEVVVVEKFQSPEAAEDSSNDDD